MFKPTTVQPTRQTKNSPRYGKSIARQKRQVLHLLLLISILFLLPLLFLAVSPVQAHVSSTDHNRPDVNFGSFVSAADATGLNRGSGFLIPAQQAVTTTLKVQIVSSPWAPLDNNNIPAGPRAFVVEAVITNTGVTTATAVEVTLAYEDAPNGWELLEGEEAVRTLPSLAPQAAYHAYWFATYPTSDGSTHQYTVTASAANASQVSTSQNIYRPGSITVETEEYQSTGVSQLGQSVADIVVGVAFTMTIDFDLGSNPVATAFSPVGNTDFDPAAFRLLATEVRFFNDSDTLLLTVPDRLYIPSVPDPGSGSKLFAKVTYTFIALTPANTLLCPYAAVELSNSRQYDNDFCTPTVPISGELNLDLSKQVNQTTVEQGDFLNYTINFTNTGSSPIEFAWIWDELPGALASIVANSPSPTPTLATDSLVAWNLGTIPADPDPDSSGSLSYSVLVDGNGQDVPDQSKLVNQASFGIDQGSLPSNPALTRTVTTTILAPALAFSKSDGEVMVAPGEPLTYTLKITNSGSVNASNLVITDVLPSNVTPITGSISPPADVQNGQTLVWNLPALAPGSTTVIIPVNVSDDFGLDGTVLTNNGTVAYQNTAGHSFATQSDTDTTSVQVPATSLQLSKTAEDVNGPPLAVNDTIIYTLQVSNIGSFTAYNVVVTDDLPNLVSCQSVSGDNAPAGCSDPLQWSIPSLASGSSATLLVTVTIKPQAEGQSIVNSAGVIGGNVPDPPTDPEVCPDGSPPLVDGSCSVTPGPSTSLALSKTAEADDPLLVGGIITYTLQVINTGSDTALNLLVTDDLPDLVSCQSVSGDNAPAGCSDPLEWSIPSLASGDSATLQVTVKVKPAAAGKSIVNSAGVTAGNVPGPPTDSEEVCPDGNLRNPDTGECDVQPGPGPDDNNIYLPLIMKNNG